MDQERQPDHTEGPRDTDTGQGYPEEQPPGADEPSGTDANPTSGTERQGEPHADADQDSEPSGAATGNPNAAGG